MGWRKAAITGVGVSRQGKFPGRRRIPLPPRLSSRRSKTLGYGVRTSTVC